jgi:hypothetical protein
VQGILLPNLPISASNAVEQVLVILNVPEIDVEESG